MSSQIDHHMNLAEDAMQEAKRYLTVDRPSPTDNSQALLWMSIAQFHNSIANTFAVQEIADGIRSYVLRFSR